MNQVVTTHSGGLGSIDLGGAGWQNRAETHAMRVGRPRHAPITLVLDACAVCVSLALGLLLLHVAGLHGVEPATSSIGVWPFLYVPVFLATFALYGMYERDRRRLFSTSFPELF